MDQTTLSLENFYSGLEKAGKSSWLSLESNMQLPALIAESHSLCSLLLALGDERSKQFESSEKTELLAQAQNYLLFYQWMDAAKSLLILWRNTGFEHLHAQLLRADEELSEEGFKKWRSDLKPALQGAAVELQEYLPQLEASFQQDPKKARKQLEAWKHQAVPWGVYRDQINLIVKQLKDLEEHQANLHQNSQYIHQLQKQVFANIHEGLAELDDLKNMATEAIEYIKDNLEQNRGRIPFHLEDLEAKIPKLNYGKSFKKKSEKSLAGLSGEIQVPVAVNGATILVKDVDFRKYISRWLDSEILPLLYEVWELTTNIRNNLKMALINIRNRAILMNNDQNDTTEYAGSQELFQPLNSFLQQTGDRIQELENLHSLIHSRMDKNFKLSSVFREEEFFLSAPLHSTLNQLRTNQNELLTLIKLHWKRQVKKIKKWLSNVQAEDAMSTSEKLVRYLDSRIPAPDNQAYTSIFLTQGYIGESFWVGRKAELKRVENLIRSWQRGYRGSVLISGDRFSGKSLFGDLVSNRFFPNETIRLSPNSTISIQGRTFSTTHDLREALSFVDKYRFDKPPLIWLDDVELWHDPSFPISRNIAALKQHMDRHATSIFYLISAGNALRSQLEKNQAFNLHFQAIIPLDSMNQEEVRQAILIRHGATHKNLVNPNAEPVDSQSFEKAVAKVYRAADGNIGEALNLWAYYMRTKGEDQVYQDESPVFTLPVFIDPDQALILRTIILEKRTNEYRLRKRFGPSFNPKYSEALLRLLSVGLIKRHLDDWLEINESAVNGVIRQLRNKQYLN